MWFFPRVDRGVSRKVVEPIVKKGFWMIPSDSLILIADDLLTIRKGIKKVCKDLGYSRFIEAFDGKDALIKLIQSDTSISLIITDWDMPEMSGFDLLKKVRENPRLRTVPFLILPDEAHAYQSSSALELGTVEVLIKPFTYDGLKSRILNIMSSQSMLDKAS